MSRKVFLTLAAIIAFTVGTVAVLLPAMLLESKGIVANTAATIWVRELGVALISIALVAFLVRGQADSPTMRAFLLGNAVLQAGLLPIEIIAFANGILTQASGIIPNSVLHVVLAFAFFYYAARVHSVGPSGKALDIDK
jgi:hypothetical protein